MKNHCIRVGSRCFVGGGEQRTIFQYTVQHAASFAAPTGGKKERDGSFGMAVQPLLGSDSLQFFRAAEEAVPRPALAGCKLSQTPTRKPPRVLQPRCGLRREERECCFVLARRELRPPARDVGVGSLRIGKSFVVDQIKGRASLDPRCARGIILEALMRNEPKTLPSLVGTGVASRTHCISVEHREFKFQCRRVDAWRDGLCGRNGACVFDVQLATPKHGKPVLFDGAAADVGTSVLNRRREPISGPRRIIRGAPTGSPPGGLGRYIRGQSFRKAINDTGDLIERHPPCHPTEYLAKRLDRLSRQSPCGECLTRPDSQFARMPNEADCFDIAGQPAQQVGSLSRITLNEGVGQALAFSTVGHEPSGILVVCGGPINRGAPEVDASEAATFEGKCQESHPD
jgi:hypothetical protein